MGIALSDSKTNDKNTPKPIKTKDLAKVKGGGIGTSPRPIPGIGTSP